MCLRTNAALSDVSAVQNMKKKMLKSRANDFKTTSSSFIIKNKSKKKRLTHDIDITNMRLPHT
jgi:hypothetical protein